MQIPLTDISGFLAVQHRMFKDLRKQTGLRQRDWEVLCACHRFSLSKSISTVTAAKLDAYMQRAYFLPSLYDSIGVLVEKGYLKVVFAGRPFRPEIYQLAYEGWLLVTRTMEKMVRLYEQRDLEVAGKPCTRFR